MIYYIYFTAMPTYRAKGMWDLYSVATHYGSRESINPQKILGSIIKESKDNSFVFILTGNEEVGMLQQFNQFLEREGLKDLVVFQPRAFTNFNYPDQTRNLNLVVLMSPTHWYRDLMPHEALIAKAEV